MDGRERFAGGGVDGGESVGGRRGVGLWLAVVEGVNGRFEGHGEGCCVNVKKIGCGRLGTMSEARWL